MRSYKALNNQVFNFKEYSLVPIRDVDKFEILKWRNDQIYHLRQNSILTKLDQEKYFKNIISKIFQEEEPKQILFSFLKNKKCIGYGGLVHINWIDRHAEISFIMNTQLEKYFFAHNWKIFLTLLEKVAFNDLNFHKIFTLAFDVRPHLYKAIEESNYSKEAILKDHYFYNNKFYDAIIHSKFNENYQ